RGFTRRYGLRRLVYGETYQDVSDAALRERRMKDWHRAWKIQLIEADNPTWDDLAVQVLGFAPLSSLSGSHPGGSRDPGTRGSEGRGEGAFTPSPPAAFMGPGLRRDD